MADAAKSTSSASVPSGLRLVVRFWGAVSGLCECYDFDKAYTLQLMIF